jgi:ankyrin repeat protein
MTPLLLAAMCGRPEAYLLLKSQNLSSKDQNGNTDLHLAAAMGHTSVAFLCDFNSEQNHFGVTPLMYAIKNKQLKICQFLLSLSDSQSLLVKDLQGESVLDYLERYTDKDPEFLIEY